MDWERHLSRRIRTSTDLRSELSSLGEALDMIDEDLPQHLREKPHWQLARERLIRAAESVSEDDIQEATLQVMVALSVDGYFKES
jgi:CBS-domain-containing membrane protein